MIMKYIPKIKSNINIFISKKSSNILDGSYTSIYKGRTMNFEDLREYVVGDNVKDIDWKASARSNTLLIRQFIAEKKHNMMIVFDNGKKMLADTKAGEGKKFVSIMSAGTLAYLANKHGDYVGAVYNSDDLIEYYQLKSTLYSIEKFLCAYDSCTCQNSNLEKSLEFVLNNIKRKTILVIITDLKGMDSISDEILRKLTIFHDVLVINVSDAELTGDMAFDMDDGLYIPKLILRDKKINQMEKEVKKEIFERCVKKLQKYKVTAMTIDSAEDISFRIIELLERHRNANLR